MWKTQGVTSLIHSLNEFKLNSSFIQGAALGAQTNHCPGQQGAYIILSNTPCFRNCGYLGTVVS